MIDVFGYGVWNYHKGNRDIEEYLERNDGFISPSCGIPLYFSKYKDWTDIDKKAIEYAHGRVLDVGCGAGRVSLYLQEKGMNVISIDRSPLAVRVSRERGVRDARVLSFEEIGVFMDNSFDSIIMFGGNFSLFGNRETAQSMLKELYRITSDKGIIIAQISDSKTEDPIHIGYQKNNIDNGRMPGEIQLRLKVDDKVGEWFNYLIASKEELESILVDTGWRVSKYIDGDVGNYISIIEKGIM